MQDDCLERLLANYGERPCKKKNCQACSNGLRCPTPIKIKIVHKKVDFGTSVDRPPMEGRYKNVILRYDADPDGVVYFYDSYGKFIKVGNQGGGGTGDDPVTGVSLSFNELTNILSATVSNSGSASGEIDLSAIVNKENHYIVTQAEYDALTPEEKEGKVYFISDGSGGGGGGGDTAGVTSVTPIDSSLSIIPTTGDVQLRVNISNDSANSLYLMDDGLFIPAFATNAALVYEAGQRVYGDDELKNLNGLTEAGLLKASQGTVDIYNGVVSASLYVQGATFNTAPEAWLVELADIDKSVQRIVQLDVDCQATMDNPIDGNLYAISMEDLSVGDVPSFKALKTYRRAQ